MNDEKDKPKPEAAWETAEREARELEEQWKQPAHDPDSPKKATRKDLKGGTDA